MRRLLLFGAIFGAACVFNPQPDPPGFTGNGGASGTHTATGVGGSLGFASSSGNTTGSTSTGTASSASSSSSGGVGGGTGTGGATPADCGDAGAQDANSDVSCESDASMTDATDNG
jgi:hypothetical protein